MRVVLNILHLWNVNMPNTEHLIYSVSQFVNWETDLVIND